MQRSAVIVGVGEADRVAPGPRSSLALNAQAAARAIAEAGLRKDQIDGLLTGYTLVEPYPFYSAAFAEYIGLRPAYQACLSLGGATGALLVQQAAAALAVGLCQTVLVAWGDSRASGATRDQMVSIMATIGGHPDFETPYGASIPSMYALVASRHMQELGTTPEQLAAVAVGARANAALHPNATLRDPITVADVLASRPIALPLRLLDCCLLGDFGAALVLTTAERARDLPARPVAVIGSGQGFTHEFISQAPELTRTGARESGRRALEQAGVGVEALDFAELYDCFTITTLVLLEELGFCGRGEGGPFVEAGHTALGGRLPINTHGGLLSYGSGGITHVIEAVRQLRGEAGARQVPDARLGLVHNLGGILSAHCTLVLGAA